MAGMRWDRNARDVKMRDGGADSATLGKGNSWGSKPVTKVQVALMVKLATDPALPERFRKLPPPPVTRNAAKKWIGKAKAQIALANAKDGVS